MISKHALRELWVSRLLNTNESEFGDTGCALVSFDKYSETYLKESRLVGEEVLLLAKEVLDAKW